jgi:hypothetical protein
VNSLSQLRTSRNQTNQLTRENEKPRNTRTCSIQPAFRLKAHYRPAMEKINWANFIAAIITIAAKAIFVAILMFARVKTIVWVVLSDIRFEKPGCHWLSVPAEERCHRVERCGN